MDGRRCRCLANGTNTLCLVATNAVDSPIHHDRYLEAKIHTIVCFSRTNSSGYRRTALQSAKKIVAFVCVYENAKSKTQEQKEIDYYLQLETIQRSWLNGRWCECAERRRYKFNKQFWTTGYGRRQSIATTAAKFQNDRISCCIAIEYGNIILLRMFITCSNAEVKNQKTEWKKNSGGKSKNAGRKSLHALIYAAQPTTMSVLTARQREKKEWIERMINWIMNPIETAKEKKKKKWFLP